MSAAARDPVFDEPLVAALLELALQEDLGDGDRTSQALVPAAARARGRLAAKEPLVVCGLPLLELVFEQLGDVVIALRAEDGHRAVPGETLATLEGSARALLAGERLALNLIQHLCGIATRTRACVDAAGGRLVVRDTRKTVPGMRLREVRCAQRRRHEPPHAADDAILIRTTTAFRDIARGTAPARGAAAAGDRCRRLGSPRRCRRSRT
jgi:nicotinate-nucleotide pyrophosphorylase (carboxylating)